MKSFVLELIMKLMAAFYLLTLFFLTCALVRCFLLYTQEFSIEGNGKVVNIQSVRGGYQITSDNNSTFYWMLPPIQPQQNDTFEKEKNSLRYYINDENVFTKEIALKRAFPFLSIKTIFILLIIICLIGILYPFILKEPIFATLTTKRNYSNRYLLFNLLIAPIILLLYFLFYLQIIYVT